MNLQHFAENKETDQEVETVETPAEDVEKVVETEKEKETVEKDEIVETPADKETKADAETIEALETQIAELTEQLSQAQSENETLKTKVSELETEKDASVESSKEAASKADEYEKTLSVIAEEKEKLIPDNIKSLMPADLSVQDKINWLDKAAGVQPEQEVEKAVVEIGKPTPVNEQVVDQSSLSARQKMANAFSEYFK